jgi:hypothetical protein
MTSHMLVKHLVLVQDSYGARQPGPCSGADQIEGCRTTSYCTGEHQVSNCIIIIIMVSLDLSGPPPSLPKYLTCPWHVITWQLYWLPYCYAFSFLAENPELWPAFTSIQIVNIVYMYHMAGIFVGVLSFVIFVVDLQSRKFPPPKINDYTDTRV